MQHFKLLFSILIILISFESKANYFGAYLDTIAYKCGDANSLVIKKSLIFMLKDNNQQCDDTFTSKLLKECPALVDCATLHSILNRVMRKNSGNIIGVTKD